MEHRKSESIKKSGCELKKSEGIKEQNRIGYGRLSVDFEVV